MKKIKRRIFDYIDDVHLRQAVNPSDNSDAVKSVGYTGDFKK